MKDKIREQISALMDGELSDMERPLLLKQMENDPSLRADWERYHLIRDALKGQSSGFMGGFSDRVSKSLDDEPVISSTRSKKRFPTSIARYVAGIGIAASVATVAVLIALPDSPLVDNANQQVAVSTPAENAPQEWVRVSGTRWDVDQPAVESRLNSYLVNHNEYSNGMQGVLPYARIVGYDNEQK